MINILLSLFASSLFTFVAGSIICVNSTLTLTSLLLRYALYLIILFQLKGKKYQKIVLLILTLAFSLLTYPLGLFWILCGIVSYLLLYELRLYLIDATSSNMLWLTIFGSGLSQVLHFFSGYGADMYNALGTSLICQLVIMLMLSVIRFNKALIIDKDITFTKRMKQGLSLLYLILYVFYNQIYKGFSTIIHLILIGASYIFSLLALLFSFILEKIVYLLADLFSKFNINIELNYKSPDINMDMQSMNFSEYAAEVQQSASAAYIFKGIAMLMIIVVIIVLIITIFRHTKEKVIKMDANNEYRETIISKKRKKKEKVFDNYKLSSLRMIYKKETEKIIHEGHDYLNTMTPLDFMKSLDEETIEKYHYQKLTEDYNVARYKNNE